MKNPDGERVEYSQEEHDRLCTEVLYNPWTYERKPCTGEAVATIGGQYIGVLPMRFCTYHWHDFRAQVNDEVCPGGLLEFVYDSMLTHGMWRVLEEERRRVRQLLKAEEDGIREQNRVLRAAREEQRRLNRDVAALASQLTAGSRVYFIQAGKRGPIKIGTARDVLKRLDELQTGNPQRLRVRATLPGAHDREHEYHRMFSEHRMAGEWFKPAAPILQEIKAIRAIAAKGEKDGALF